ncbi:MAG TPA: haloacid dehalogenase type II [Streptosporangiaceae bacterium]
MPATRLPQPWQAGPPGAWRGVRTLVFDVLGTVVDESGSITELVTAALASGGADPAGGPALAARWNDRVEALTSEIAVGQAPWRGNDELRRAALLETLAADPRGAGRLSADVLEDLALAGHRLRPWPDAAAAVRVLAGSFTVVALSNASVAQLADMFAAGGLAWHGVLSGELARAYKPDPAAYQLAIRLLDLDPAATMMVAAHPWDLRAAAGHGLRTAYVARPGEGVPGPDDRFDVQVAGLAELAARLTGSGGTGPD